MHKSSASSSQEQGGAVVIPVRDEKGNIPALLEQLQVRLGFPQWQVYFVEGGSIDGTRKKLEEACEQYLGLHLEKCEKVGDLACAWRAGANRALTEGAVRVGFMDADLCHDPSELSSWENGSDSDLIIGSRFAADHVLPKMAKRVDRRVITFAVQQLFNRWQGASCKVRDPAHGFRLINKSALKGFLQAEQRSGLIAGNSWMLAMTDWCIRSGFSVVEEPISYGLRKSGNDKLNPFREGKRLLRYWLNMRKTLLDPSGPQGIQ